ncbi:reverse transcriptase domain-containing protein [Tanacetum coccineum]|uniref:Reverse transcriptase domain-containing protein n=1 Tax=Tanacetum coccineum TaxID=301880 RepID=A0ABQ5EVJ6_9ASTR
MMVCHEFDSRTQVENPTRVLPSHRQKKRGRSRARKAIWMSYESKRAMVAGGCAWTSPDLNQAHVHRPAIHYRDRLESGVLMRIPLQVLLGRIQGVSPIQMAKDDEEKTAFHTSQGVYCYTKMPFGLKNVGAPTSDCIMKLNPKKCTFGATEGMFLGYLIEPDGIKPCPEKTKAVIQLPSPRTMKEVQSLNGKSVRDGRLLWTTEAEEAFTMLKQHIAALPTLVAPRPGEELIIYLSATHGAISAVLLTDKDSVQTPVYFVSKALKETEINYSAMEKADLA